MKHLSSHELLHMLLDRELNPVDEVDAYRTLLDDTGAQTQFRKLLEVRSAVLSDLDTLEPLDEHREAIFSALGLSTAPAGTMPVPMSTTSRSGGMARPLFTHAVSAVIGALLAMLFVWQHPMEGAGSEQLSSATTRSTAMSPTVASATDRGASDAPMLHDRSSLNDLTPLDRALDRALEPAANRTGAASGRRRAVPADTRPRGNVIKPADAENRAMAQAQTNGIDSAPLSPTALAIAPAATLSLSGIAFPPRRIELSTRHIDPSESRNDISPVVLHVRGFAARSFPTPTIQPQSEPWFRNMAVGISYRFDERNELGIEVGQQALMQQYRGMEADSIIRYEQNPMTAWGGAFYTHTARSIDILGFHPYGRLLAGSTKFGPIAKATIGMNYMLDDRVGFSIGLEGSSAFYRHQRQWFSTEQLGVSYGLSWQF